MHSPGSGKNGNSRPRLSAGGLILSLVAACLAVAAGAALRQFGWDHLKIAVRTGLGPPLKALHGPLDRLLDSLPMWVAQACAISLFVLAGLFAWCLPRRFVYLGAPDHARWRDLRIWATLVLVPYVLIYYFLGL
jgi:hypothetical protein